MGAKTDLAERDLRYKRIREAMGREGLEAVLVYGHGSRPGCIQYFTNYRSGWHELLLLIPLTGEPVVTINSYARVPDVLNAGWVSDVRGALNIWDASFVGKIAEAMREKGVAKGRVGIVGHEWVLPLGHYEKLRGALPAVQLVNADELMDRLRLVKSPLEIRQIREDHRVIRAALERFLDAVEPGRTEVELANEFVRAAVEGGAERSSVQIGETRMGEGGPVFAPRNVRIRGNDLLRLYPSIVGRGGHANEQMVTCAFREPTELEAKLMESEIRAYDEIRRMARPGVRLSEMASVLERVLIEDGWRLGTPRSAYDFHSIGLDSVERPVFAQIEEGRAQDWPLEAGAVVNYHARRDVRPSPGSETGIDEDILITPNGAERLLGEDFDLRWRRIDR